MMTMSASFILAVLLSSCAAGGMGQGSCQARCGERFSRGQPCHCDPSCLAHDECCKDFEAVCTAAESCRGRCGEIFRRGRLCDCDLDCALFNTCCHDYQLHCDSSSSATQQMTVQSTDATNCPKYFLLPASITSENQGTLPPESPLTSDLFILTDIPTGPAKPVQEALSDATSSQSTGHAALLSPPISSPPSGPASGTLGPSKVAPLTGNPVHSPPSSPGGPLSIQLLLTPDGMPQSGSQPQGGSQPQSGPVPQGTPVPQQGSVQPQGVSDSPDLCMDTPINALTALANGTLMVFRGEFFWTVDPQTKTPGPPRSIPGELGIPAPIDSAFTRCNCQGSTYIIKGDQVWRLDNGIVETGSPRSLSSAFAGLSGRITAALPIPATRRRPEAVYFFKKGGSSIQKLSFPPESTSSCIKKPRTSSSSSQNHPARDTGEQLSAEVALRVSLKGFPSPVSSALSLQNSKKTEGYEYYVFSGPLFFNVKISGELPALTKPDSSSVLIAKQNQGPRAEQNPLRAWLQCV